MVRSSMFEYGRVAELNIEPGPEHEHEQRRENSDV
jgi:hypothetical protein